MVLEAPNAGKTNLKLNGHDRMAPREERYFTEVQRYQHHTGSTFPLIGKWQYIPLHLNQKNINLQEHNFQN